jgi:hypothetical protein
MKTIGKKVIEGHATVSDEAYDATSWNGSTEVPTKNAIRDKIEALPSSPTRDSLGLDTDDTPQFAGINLGHASDTTIARVSAGVASIEGNNIITANIVATDTVAGIVELATDAEMTTGTATNRAITPANAKVELDKKLALAGGTLTGAVQPADHGTATNPEVVAVVYGTGLPPDANTTPEGTIWLKY